MMCSRRSWRSCVFVFNKYFLKYTINLWVKLANNTSYYFYSKHHVKYKNTHLCCVSQSPVSCLYKLQLQMFFLTLRYRFSGSRQNEGSQCIACFTGNKMSLYDRNCNAENDILVLLPITIIMVSYCESLPLLWFSLLFCLSNKHVLTALNILVAAMKYPRKHFSSLKGNSAIQYRLERLEERKQGREQWVRH